MTYVRRITQYLAIALLLTAAGCAGDRSADRNQSGTYSITYDNVGGLVGFHTGKGELSLNDGSVYAFSADGYSLAGLGYSVAAASGDVYNLSAPADLAGEYGALGGVAIFGSGGGKAGLKNRGNNVVLEITSAEKGLRLGLGGGYVTFKLGEQLKGPRVAAVKAPEPAPAVAAKPMRHEIEFGFNKSRVTLATQKLLDTIAADWKDAKVTFDIVGHADTIGSSAYNMKLSTSRADSVMQALVERGIATDRISARGVGKTDLAVATADKKRLRANRRVVITIRDVK